MTEFLNNVLACNRQLTVTAIKCENKEINVSSRLFSYCKMQTAKARLDGRMSFFIKTSE